MSDTNGARPAVAATPFYLICNLGIDLVLAQVSWEMTKKGEEGGEKGRGASVVGAKKRGIAPTAILAKIGWALKFLGWGNL